MKRMTRRSFILSCSTGVAASVLARIDEAYSQGYNLGSFWRAGTVAAPVAANVRITQFVARAAILDTTMAVRTTQVLAKAAVLDNSFQIRTTQVLAKAAVLDNAYQLRTTQVIAKAAVIDPAVQVRTTQFVVKVAALL